MGNHEYLIWIDLEMTGLMPDTDQIIEIATVLTDNDLNVVAEGPDLVIQQPEEVLARMDAWNQRQHGSSGLLTRARAPDAVVPEHSRATGHVADVRQQHLSGQALSGTVNARARALLPLS